MIRFLADENFNRHIVRGLRRRKPDLDLALAQEVGLTGVDDPTVLDWAARDDRVVLTHDVSTMSQSAYERAGRGQPMPGVFEMSEGIAIGRAIEDILLLAECSLEGEWEGQVRHLPL